jgi:hypothetical protein
MPATTILVTPALARAELARRAAPKGSAKRRAIPAHGTSAHAAFGMGRDELAAIAGKRTSAPVRTSTPAPVAVPTPAPVAPKAPAFTKSDSEIRKAIFAHTNAQDIPMPAKKALYRALLAQAGLDAKRSVKATAKA